MPDTRCFLHHSFWLLTERIGERIGADGADGNGWLEAVRGTDVADGTDGCQRIEVTVTQGK